MSKLTGKVAIATGASKGIGASIAERFGAAGATVVVNYASRKSGADAVVGRITEKGGKAIAVQADLSNEQDIARLFKETITAYGKLDILVNNAGIYDFAPIQSVTPEHFHKQFNLNVLGLLLASKHAAALLPEGRTIINISSIVGRMPVQGGSVYSATKAAVDAITVSLSKELGPKRIRVNSLSPGMVETEGHRGSRAGGSRRSPDAAPATKRRIPQARARSEGRRCATKRRTDHAMRPSSPLRRALPDPLSRAGSGCGPNGPGWLRRRSSSRGAARDRARSRAGRFHRRTVPLWP